MIRNLYPCGKQHKTYQVAYNKGSVAVLLTLSLAEEISCSVTASSRQQAAHSVCDAQDHAVFKKRLSSTGETIDDEVEQHKVGPEEDERLLHDQQTADNETKPCGSCYGAAAKPEDCCNTCDEVGA